MEQSLTLERLARIRGKYRAIATITKEMCRQSDPEALVASVSDRRRLLGEIEGEQRALQPVWSTWSELALPEGPLAVVVEDIRALIRSIATMDTRLQGILQRRMRQVRDELGNLARSSRAALSYANHATIGVSRMR
jgi:hypothetical protein